MLGARKFAKTRGFTGDLTAVLHTETKRIAVATGFCHTPQNTFSEVTSPIVGPIIENPLHGERIRFLRTVPETNGELVQYESWLAPGGSVGAPHTHPLQESRFTVGSGTPSSSHPPAPFHL